MIGSLIEKLETLPAFAPEPGYGAGARFLVDREQVISIVRQHQNAPELIEHMAIALSQWRNDCNLGEPMWDRLRDAEKAAYREQAKAAIAAMQDYAGVSLTQAIPAAPAPAGFEMPDGRPVFGEGSPHDIGRHLDEVVSSEIRDNEKLKTAAFNAITLICGSVSPGSSLGKLLLSQRSLIADAVIGALQPYLRIAEPAAGKLVLGDARKGAIGRATDADDSSAPTPSLSHQQSNEMPNTSAIYWKTRYLLLQAKWDKYAASGRKACEEKTRVYKDFVMAVAMGVLKGEKAWQMANEIFNRKNEGA